MSAETISVRFDAAGVVPVVAQDVETGEVLLLAYMNDEALRRTLAEGVLVLWSRSRQRLWRKGEQSGHSLRVRELRINCEENSLLARVTLEGPGACHEGYRSCYFRRIEQDTRGAFTATITSERVFDPTQVYGARNSGGNAAQVLQGQPLEADARALYAAYERLRDEDHTARSRTSRLLRREDREAVAAEALRRAREELEELRGVLAGTHRHHGGEADVILEASQVHYWLLVAAVALGYPYDAWQPHLIWLGGSSAKPAAPLSGKDEHLASFADVLGQTASLCANAGVAPERVIAADLRAMREKHGSG